MADQPQRAVESAVRHKPESAGFKRFVGMRCKGSLRRPATIPRAGGKLRRRREVAKRVPGSSRQLTDISAPPEGMEPAVSSSASLLGTEEEVRRRFGILPRFCRAVLRQQMLPARPRFGRGRWGSGWANHVCMRVGGRS